MAQEEAGVGRVTSHGSPVAVVRNLGGDREVRQIQSYILKIPIVLA